MFLIEKKKYYDMELDEVRELTAAYEGSPEAIVRRKDNGASDDIFVAFRGFKYDYDFMLIICDFYAAGHGQRWKCYLFDEEEVAGICKLQDRFSEDEIIHGYVEAPEWETEE